MNPNSLLDAITRKDAVVFVPDPRDRRTTTLLSDGIANVVRAMEAKGVRRVLTVSSAGLELLAHLAYWETYQRKLLISSNGNGRGGAGT